MSFDIYFQPCRFSGPPVPRKNPFTKKVILETPNEPLLDHEVTAVRKVLADVSKASADGGHYSFQTADGGEGEVYTDKLTTGCMVALRNKTADIHRLLFEILKAGNWVMLPAMEDRCAITTSLENLRGIPEDFPPIAVCQSPDDIGMLLNNGYGKWQKYRNQIRGNTS